MVNIKDKFNELTLWGLGYNWLFLTTFDFTIIFHLKNYYFQHNLTCVTVQLFFSF